MNFSAMNLRTTILLCAGILLCVQCSPPAEIPRRDAEPVSWEKIAWPLLDETVRLSNLRPLRETPIRHDDLEVRFWRGFGLGKLEGVILKQEGGFLSGRHIIANHYVKPTKTSAGYLKPPKSGWNTFWNEVVSLGLLSIPDCRGEPCFSKIDGTGYVVEIRSNGAYRTYHYPSICVDCEYSLQMDKISEYIGIEFDDGIGKCLTEEWFPCAKVLRERRLSGDLKE